MSVLTMQERLQREVSTLPEDLAREVFDFLVYVRDQQTEDDFWREQIEAAEAYRHDHPEDVMIMTAEEWEANMEGKLTAVFERDGQWWIGYVEELPGANTQGETLEEARENLVEAIQLVIEANREMTCREIEGRSVIREDIRVAA